MRAYNLVPTEAVINYLLNVALVEGKAIFKVRGIILLVLEDSEM